MIRATITALVLAIGAATACGQAPLTGPAATPSQSSVTSPVPEATPIGATSPPPGTTINVSGVLDRGRPPACPTGEPCDPPATATYLVFSQPGRPDVRVYVDPSGAFSAYLAPGAYTISAAPPPMQGRLSPDTVRVPSGGTINLHLVISLARDIPRKRQSGRKPSPKTTHPGGRCEPGQNTAPRSRLQ